MGKVELSKINVHEFGPPKKEETLVANNSSMTVLDNAKGASSLPADLPTVKPVTAPSPIQQAADTIVPARIAPSVIHAGDNVAKASPDPVDFADHTPVVSNTRAVSKKPAGAIAYIHPAQFALALEKTTRMLQDIRISDAIANMKESQRKYTDMCKEYMKIWESMSAEEKKKQMIATANKSLTLFSTFCSTIALASEAFAIGSATPALIALAVMSGINLGVQYYNLTNQWDELAKSVVELTGTEEKKTALVIKEVANVASLFFSLATMSYYKPDIIAKGRDLVNLMRLPVTDQNRDPLALYNAVTGASSHIMTALGVFGVMAEAKIDHDSLKLQADMKDKESGRKKHEEELNSKASAFGGIMKFTKQIFERAQKFIQQSTIKTN